MVWLELTSHNKKILLNMATVARIEPYPNYTLIYFGAAKEDREIMVEVSETAQDIEKLLGQSRIHIAR